MFLTISPILVLFLCILLYFGFWAELLQIAALATLHELGHLLALCLCRIPVRGVHLGLFGTRMETMPASYGHELLCAAAGPAVNLLLLPFLPAGSSFQFADLGILLCNLLPVYPLDGGRILRCLLLQWFSPSRVARWMTRAAVFTGVVLSGLAIYMTFVLKLSKNLLYPAIFLGVKCIYLAKDSRA